MTEWVVGLVVIGALVALWFALGGYVADVLMPGRRFRAKRPDRIAKPERLSLTRIS